MSAWWWLLVACAPDPATAPVAPVEPPAPEAPAAPPAEAGPPPETLDPATPLTYELRVVGAAEDAALPLVVLLHGRGGKASTFVRMMGGFDRPVRVVAPDAPYDWQDGRAWYPGVPAGSDPAELADLSRDAADRVHGLVVELVGRHATVGRPVIVGYSQGGMVASVLALRHPEAYALAVPIGGMIPEGVVGEVAKKAGARVPIRALHGTADEVVPYALARFGVERAGAAGLDVTLESFEGLGHRPDDQVTRRMYALVREALDAPVARP